MKKILLVVAGMFATFQMNAQVMPMQQTVKAPLNPTQVQNQYVRMPEKSVVNNNMLNTVNVHKATTGDYETVGWASAYSFALNYAGQENLAWKGGAFDLMPDSLAIFATHYTDVDSMLGSHPFFHKGGFVFDPYSRAFDTDWEQMWFGRYSDLKDSAFYYPYAIDSMQIRVTYTMGEDKDPNITTGEIKPDTLRVYIQQHPVYQINSPGNKDEYYRWTYTEAYGRASFLTPVANYVKSASTDKGSVTIPKGRNQLVINHILTEEDSTLSELGKIGWRGILLDLNRYEVEAGAVVSVMVEFIPGYDYDFEDTLEITSWNRESSEMIAKRTIKSTLAIPYCNYKDEGGNDMFEWGLDMGGGVNGKLCEPKAVRYDLVEYWSDGTINDQNKHQYRNSYFATLPLHIFKLAVDEGNPLIRIDSTSINEVEMFEVSVFPNPAVDQINVVLSNEEPAVATLFNLVGQAVVSVELKNENNTIDVSNFAPGIYMLKVNQGNKVKTTKVTIR